MDEPDDIDVVRRVLDGHINDFELLIDRHRSKVASIVSGHVPPDCVGDVTADVFLDAYRALAGYRPTRPFGHWLARIATRRCCDYWRRRKRSREAPFASFSPDAQVWLENTASDDAEAHPPDGRYGEAAREVLRSALAALPADDRMALTLVHMEERPVREAAELLGWSAAKVKIRTFRARRKLRVFLGRTLRKEPT